MRKFTARDIPTIRATRDAYREILERVEEVRGDTRDVGKLVGFALIKADIQDKFETLGRHLTRLERQPLR
jgi:hypothetical protein